MTLGLAREYLQQCRPRVQAFETGVAIDDLWYIKVGGGEVKKILETLRPGFISSYLSLTKDLRQSRDNLSRTHYCLETTLHVRIYEQLSDPVKVLGERSDNIFINTKRYSEKRKQSSTITIPQLQKHTIQRQKCVP